MISKKLSLNLFALALTILTISLTSALAGCCIANDAGDTCTSNVDSSECAPGNFRAGVNCNFVNECKPGCCINEDQGSCDSSTIQSTCIANGGEWSEGSSCNEVRCQEGCCDLGDWSIFLTQGQCNLYAERYGFNSETANIWDPEIIEPVCARQSTDDLLGACVTEPLLGDRSCEITTNERCAILENSEFHWNKLCTSPDLNTICEKTEITSCHPNKDQVYFMDSCNNYANVYDSSKVDDEDYWDEMISIEDSCNYGSGNQDSESCGNCNFEQGGICAPTLDANPEIGNNICRPTTCDYNGTTYNSGESWCVYETKIGEGDDVPGSRHRLFSCHDGEINTDEVCGEKRNEVCMDYDTIDENTNEVIFHEAHCRTNPVSADLRRNACHSISQELFSGGDVVELTTECNENPFCSIKGVAIDKFKFSFCTPDYPIGFDQYPETPGMEQAQNEICSLGSQTCNRVEQRKLRGLDIDWVCIQNCQCNTEIFTAQMNEMCTSLGDCGGNVNLAGEFTHDGYSVSGAPGLSQGTINSYIKKLDPVPGLFVSRNSNELTLAASLALTEQGGSVGGDDFTGGFGWGGSWSDGWATPITAWVKGTFGWAFEAWDWFAGKVLGLGKTRTRHISFTCEPWRPPKGGDNCELCNDDFEMCNKYRCESLGATCELLNEGEEGVQVCISIPFEPNPPVISEGEPDLGITYVPTDDGFEIKTAEGKCIQAPGRYNITFKTDEPAQCKFITIFDGEEDQKRVENNPEYFRDNMSYFGSNAYLTNHKEEVMFIHPDAGIAQGLNMTYDQEWHILCEDKHENRNWPVYRIETCLNEAEDIFPPRVVITDPANNSKIGFDATLQNLSILTNEFAECRWSDEVGKNFSEMENSFTCASDIGELSSFDRLIGYKCNATLPVLEDSNKVYIKCSDQPWLPIVERNINPTDYVHTSKRVEEKIKIDLIAPSGELETKTNELDTIIRVQTSGGANVHLCKYQILIEGFHPMEISGERTHKQGGLKVPVGTHTIGISCSDETGDTVEGSEILRVIKDDRAPKIARIQSTSSGVTLVTSEDAVCRFSTERCKFDWSTGTELSSGTLHSFSTEGGERYYVKCKDEWENEPKTCSLTLGG